MTIPIENDTEVTNQVTNQVTKQVTIPIENSTKVTNQNIEDAEVELSELECRILNLVQTNSEVTFVGIAEELRVSRKHIAACMKMLKEKGMIVRRGNNRKGYWDVKRKR